MANGGYDWVDEGEKAAYRQAVLDCLDDRRLSELLELRPTITREAVAEAMCASPYVEQALGEGSLLYRFVRRRTVHYLISVAEDVGAAFVRRGLPHRDVTDSSLDDVVHVRRCTLAESAEILKKRAPGIGDAYIVLAHALSGGIPRDLIRYGRRLLEIRLVTEQVELPDVAQALIIEELSETLAGFRTLLSKQRWQPETQGVLGSFRNLAAHLRVACPCPEPMEQLRDALAHFVAYEVDGLTEESRGLIDEAAAYAYLSLTLLDIFGQPGFNQRRAEATRRSPDGNPDLLAEARQELAVSPYSTRPLIDGIRRAWRLDEVSAQGPRPTVMIPPPRGTACVGHHPI